MTKAVLALLAAGAVCAQVPSPEPAQKPAANLVQLMRGTFYPQSYVVFAAQDTNPADVPHAKDPAMSTDLLTSQYGKWDAVDNSALAIEERGDLLLVPA